MRPPSPAPLARLLAALGAGAVAACAPPPAAPAATTASTAPPPAAVPPPPSWLAAREVADADDGPPALAEHERAALGGECALLEAPSFDGIRAARSSVEEAYWADPRSAAADAAALELALAPLAKAPPGMPATAHAACLPLYRKRFARELWELEPAAAAAKDVLSACQQAAASAFDTPRPAEAARAAGHASGPFCPASAIVPPDLAALPYTSTKADWDTPSWRCLPFALRSSQPFQLGYASDARGFSCVARFAPRHGGPVVELRLGAELVAGGLRLDKSPARRRIELAAP